MKGLSFSCLKVAGVRLFVMTALGHQTLEQMNCRLLGILKVLPVSLVTMATVNTCPLCWASLPRALHVPHTLTKAPVHRGRLRLGENLAEVTLGTVDEV